MSMSEHIAAPAVAPNPGTTLSTPSGIPAFKTYNQGKSTISLASSN